MTRFTPIVVTAAAAVAALAAVIAAAPDAAPAPSAAASSYDAATPPGSLPGDWYTYHGNRQRTGVAVMPALTRAPARLTSVALDAAVYASPIVARGVTVVATENNSLYGYSRAGARLWRTNLGRPARLSDLPCGNIDPLGITGTPTYDASSGLVFAVAEHRAPVRHELVALSPTTGVVRWRRSVDLPGVDATAMQQRGALIVDRGRVWVPFGGLAGDCGAYKGRVVGVATSGAGAAVAYTVPTTREAGIWAPPGPSLDAYGHLLVAVGNGESGPGDRYDFSDSVLQLSGTRLTGSFSPRTWATDNAADLDLGSQGPAVVGRQWVFIAGKSGTAYVLRQNALGGIGGEVSSAPICRSFGGTAVIGDVVYVPCTDGVRAVRISARGIMTVLWRAAAAVTGSPVVGGGRVWALDVGAGRLHALDPRTGRTLSSTSVGAVTRFATPALSASRVIVPTKSGFTVVRAD